MKRKHWIRGLAATASLITLVGVVATPPALAAKKSRLAKKCVKKPLSPACVTTTTRPPATTLLPTTTRLPTTTLEARPALRNDSMLAIAPTAVTQTTAGGLVGFVITGTSWTGNVQLSSPGLDIACPGNPDVPFKFLFSNATGSGTSGFIVPSDDNGQFKVIGEGANCLPGTYTIEAQEVASPARQRTATITINRGNPPVGLIVSPNAQTETGSRREVAVALIVNGLSGKQPYALASPGLQGACAATSVAPLNRPLVFSALPARGPTFITNFVGNAPLVLFANACLPGTYAVTVTEIGGLGRSFPTGVTVLPT